MWPSLRHLITADNFVYKYGMIPTKSFQNRRGDGSAKASIERYFHLVVVEFPKCIFSIRQRPESFPGFIKCHHLFSKILVNGFNEISIDCRPGPVFSN